MALDCPLSRSRLLHSLRKWAMTRFKQTKSSEIEPRLNPLGIQMLSPNLHKQIFGGPCAEIPDERAVNESIKHLKKHKLWGQESSRLADLQLELPKLLGENISEHFQVLGSRYSQRYRQLAEQLVKKGLPELPEHWKYQPGWTRYSQKSVEAVDFPQEPDLVLDVEICLQQEGHFPTLATAASTEAWYSWCSERLIMENFDWSKEMTLNDLIPLASNATNECNDRWQEKLVVGHNVAFDRSFIREQYFVDGTKQRFLDTMSLHVCISGQTGLQRNMSIAHKSAKDKNQMFSGEMAWLSQSSLNNLSDVHQLYCKGKPLNKDPRDVFVDGTLQDVRDSFQSLVNYCANDVIATFEVLQKILPIFLERFPHPVTLAGMLEMSVTYLPVNQLWERYLQHAQEAYDDKEKELKIYLTRLANDACSFQQEQRYMRDPWLWDLDWTTQTLKCYAKYKELDENVDHVAQIYQTSTRLHKRKPFLPGYPKWYRNLCIKPGDVTDEEWEPGPVLVTTQLRCMPKLMRLTWDGYPLHYDKKHGWGYLVPGRDSANEETDFPLQDLLDVCGLRSELKDDSFAREEMDDYLYYQELGSYADEKDFKLWGKTKKKNKESDRSHPSGNGPYDDVEIPGCWFFRLPHKDGPDHRVGNPLSHNFLSKYSEGILRSHSGAEAQLALQLNKMLSYWKNNQKRICSQMVVWLQERDLPDIVTWHESYDEDDRYGAILPRLVPAGTVTRRAVEATWLTASNAYEERIGSELKSMIQAPPGYHFVGADVDSQELWIASLLGDAHFASLHGATALGWMTLQGKKSCGTDMHSRVASSVGITRSQAKVLNYGRIYGAGQKFAQRLLMQFNPRLSLKEASQKAKNIYVNTKGVKSFKSSFEQRKVWIGGSESHMFNKLEEIANDEEPSTPVLGCRISRALEPSIVSENFLTSRVNWVVQSSAVDFLHLMLVCMRWLFEEMQVKGRFSISIHDEVHYLVVSSDRYKAALALQLTNLLVRSLFAHKMGIDDLPQSVAFFSLIDIDTVLRKEVDMDCMTPSNPHGLAKGHSIPPGEALDIYQILEKVQETSNL